MNFIFGMNLLIVPKIRRIRGREIEILKRKKKTEELILPNIQNYGRIKFLGFVFNLLSIVANMRIHIAIFLYMIQRRNDVLSFIKERKIYVG